MRRSGFTAATNKEGSKLKIAVYAICKNEEQFVERWMDSMSEADVVCVADTGSKDETAGRLQARGAVVHTVSIEPWRFDVARNASLHLVPRDVDVCVCTDLDEVFEAGWRRKIEQAWTGRTTRLKYKYTWSFNPDGSRGIEFWSDKIHSRHGYRWKHPVHEVLEYEGENPEAFAWSPGLQLNHYPDDSKSRGQYLPLLELSVQETPNDDRMVHYLGREYMFRRMWDRCIDTLRRHLDMPEAQWINERCASMRYIARAYQAKGDAAAAAGWLYRAIAEAPQLREPYVEMAMLAYWDRDWPRVYHMVEEALKIKEKSQTYLDEVSSWNETVYDLGAVSCFELGMLDKSLSYAASAVGLAPHDLRLTRNYEIISAKAGNRTSGKA